MNKEIRLSRKDLSQKEYTVVENRINGRRHGLEGKISSYYPKDDGNHVFSAIKTFFLAQDAAYDQIRGSTPLDDSNAIILATAFSSLVGSSMLGYKGEDGSSFFTNRRMEYGGDFLETSTRFLILYQQSLMEERGTTKLEALTSSFFEWIAEGAASELSEKKIISPAQTYTLILEGKSYQLEQSCGSGDASSGKTAKKSRLTLDISRYITWPDQFDDTYNEKYIFGQEQAKKELGRLAKILQNQEYFTKIVEPKKLFPNYLLAGPPGTGKTTLVFSMAKHCGLPVIYIPAAELLSEYFSKSASNLHAVYNGARTILEKGESKGVIIVFDEFDHIAKKRGYGHSSENDGLITTLNENLDGRSSKAGIITFGATNLPGMLDPAILSRFKQIYVGYPQNNEEIKGIHEIIIKKMEERPKQKLFDSVDYEKLLRYSSRDERFKAGRAINDVLHEALIEKSLCCIRKPFTLITTEDLIQAYESYNLDGIPLEKNSPVGFATKTR